MKSTPKIVEKILDVIDESDTFCVVGHMRPDGDCIGSQLGLTLALQNQGKEVMCWNDDPIPDKLKFLDPKQIVQTPIQGCAFDCVIATDAASLERLGNAGGHIADRKVFINIDHHQSNTRYADINWVGRDPSSGELIYKLIRAAGWNITSEISDCLFTAISTDTGSFQYPTTRPETYEIAGDLVRRGANLARICDEVYQSYPLSRVKLLKHLYNHFRLTENNRIGYFWLKKADYNRTGACPNDSEGLIDHIRDIEPVEVACLFEELTPGEVRISLRSKSLNLSVNEIAKKFGGGGHQAAAGARLTGNPMSIQRKVIGAIRAELRKPESNPT